MSEFFFVFLACEYPIVLAPFFEKTILSQLNCMDTIAKNQLAINVKTYLWTLSSFPLIYMHILHQHHSLDYYSFIVSFEIRECKSSGSSYSKYFGYLRVLHFHIHFRISLSFSIKKSVELDRDCIEFQFGESCHVDNLSLVLTISVCEHEQ